MKKVDIYEELKNRIVKNEYAPGQVLNEIEISKEFNISRTPVRNAFQRLEMDMLLTIVPRYGVQVSFIDFTNMKSLFELTRVLDPMATREAVHKISKVKLDELRDITEKLSNIKEDDDYQTAIDLDEAFHSIIMDSCGNPWLRSTLKDLHIHTERLWHYCNEYFNDVTIFSKRFKKIIEAIEIGDENMAEENARLHIDDYVSKVKEALF
ncbi:GntR family transcriptional regulator [Peptostreptococcus equinus]|uniref:GntR family transcriptional regulator n=1 Tax=Peptostreptococcus equinus TaxID=3003601 RepID=A0ABY7JT26_9FIRM|nr:GntR family transcriptional regulator [Peptostreptococcus sp. CBA3647]WAW15323.1 GntR family transcriptional regulator [Peptostreptococcus sp. CBA3647]